MTVTFHRKHESTVVVTFRVDAKLHFGLQLLARKQSRSINSTMEWAIKRLIEDPSQGLIEQGPVGRGPLRNVLEEVWDPEEPDRTVNLAEKFPALLTHDETRTWKAIKEDPSLWTKDGRPDLRRIRSRWDGLKRESAPLRRKSRGSK